MNMNYLQLALPSTSMPNQNAFTFQNPYPQQFSIPYPIIKYFFQDPKFPNAWWKLIRTCKYFYSKNPLLPVADLDVTDESCYANVRKIDLSAIPTNIWLWYSMTTTANANITSSIIQKVVKCDLRSLKIYYQSLNWNDYQKLTSSGTIKELLLNRSVIKNNNGKSVPFDLYLQNLDEIERILITCDSNPLMFPEGTVKKMVEHFKRLKAFRYFHYFGVPENFDFASFKDFLLQNKKVSIHFQYRDPIFDDAYKTMIQNTIKEIMKNPSLKVPDVGFL